MLTNGEEMRNDIETKGKSAMRFGEQRPIIHC